MFRAHRYFYAILKGFRFYSYKTHSLFAATSMSSNVAYIICLISFITLITYLFDNV